MSSRTAFERVRMPRGGGPAPGAAGPRHGAAPRPGLSGSASSSGRLPECNWWGDDRQQQASTPRPRQQRSRSSRQPARAPPTGKGNRELVRRALAPPAARGVLRRWSFRPAPSRLRNASTAAAAPASGLATTAAVMISSCA